MSTSAFNCTVCGKSGHTSVYCGQQAVYEFNPSITSSAATEVFDYPTKMGDMMALSLVSYLMGGRVDKTIGGVMFITFQCRGVQFYVTAKDADLKIVVAMFGSSNPRPVMGFINAFELNQLTWQMIWTEKKVHVFVPGDGKKYQLPIALETPSSFPVELVFTN